VNLSGESTSVVRTVLALTLFQAFSSAQRERPKSYIISVLIAPHSIYPHVR